MPEKAVKQISESSNKSVVSTASESSSKSVVSTVLEAGKRSVISTACRGCHGGCMHLLTIENGRVTQAKPDPKGPLNRGRACVKGMSIVEQMYHPDRIIYPMKRLGDKCSGRWERISWEEAYQMITEKVTELWDKYGRECIALTTGTGRHHLAQYWRFANLLGTPNATSSGALICLGPRMNAGKFTAGVFAGADYYGEIQPKGILVWGANPAISGADGELQWWIKDAKKAGIPLCIVDPKPNELTVGAAHHLRVKPGTDGALALGIMNYIVEMDWYDHDFVENWTIGFPELCTRLKDYPLEKVAKICELDIEEIKAAADFIAHTRPLTLEWGTAVEQTVNSLQTCRAIYMLMGLTGNWDIPGGFVASKEIAPSAYPMFEALSEEQGKKIIAGDFPLNDGRMSPKMFAHPYYTFEAMKSGEPYPIRGLFAHANNSLISMPDAGHVAECLKEVEFFVYMDFFMTPTAEYADLFLPAALWPELDSYYPFPEFADQALLCQQKVAQVGECISDEEFFLELCKRLGLDYGAESQEEILNQGLSAMGERYPQYKDMTFAKLKEVGYLVPPREYYGYQKRGFATPSGKFEFYCQAIADGGGDGLPYYEPYEEARQRFEESKGAKEYPLVLTTGARIQQFFVSNNRQIKSLRKTHPFPIVSLHPKTAAAYGIEDGDWVFVENEMGRITQKAELLAEMKENVINCEMGWWYPEAGAPDYGWRESNINLLTRGDGPCDPVSGAYQLRGLSCRIYKNPDAGIEKRYEAWLEQA